MLPCAAPCALSNLLSPEEHLLLAVSKQHLGMSAGTAPEEAGVGGPAPGCCLAGPLLSAHPWGGRGLGPGPEPSSALLNWVLSPASAPTGVPGATCSQVPEQGLERLRWQAGAGGRGEGDQGEEWGAGAAPEWHPALQGGRGDRSLLG